MKILLFSDPHVTSSSEFSSPSESGLNEYLDLVVKSLDFVYDQCVIHKPDVLAFGGDFFDARDYVDTMAMSVGFNAVQKLSDPALGIKHRFAIVGNHDYFSEMHAIHSLGFFKGMGWTVFENADVKLVEDTLFAFLPFRDEYEIEALEAINEAKPAVVFSHLDVLGGLRRSSRGDWDTKAFSDHGLLQESLKDCGIVLNGHYHHPSQVSDNWQNVGSLTSRSFHDKDSGARGIVLYDTVTKVLTRIENPHARRFVDVFIETQDDLTEVLSQDYSNCYARVYYNLALADQVADIDDFFAGTRKVPVAREVVQAKADAVDVRFSLDDNLSRYIMSEYDDTALRDLGLQILNEVGANTSTSTLRKPLEFGIINLENFQCFKKASIDLRNRGLLLVKGVNEDDEGHSDNGAGKTTLIEAIYWCLKGVSLRDYGANDVIHWEEQYCSVSLQLVVGEEVYTVIRSRKHPYYGTGVQLYLGDAAAGARISEDTDRKLEELIGRSDENLRHVCFLIAGLSQRFSALNYAARARLLEDVIDSKPYQEAEELADEKLSQTALARTRVQGSLQIAIDQVKSCDLEIEDVRKDIQDFDLNSAQERLDLQAQLEALENERIASDVRIRDLESTVSNLATEADTLRTKRKSIDESYRAVGRDIAGIQSRLAVAKSELTRIGGLLAQELCPTCGVKIDQADFTAKRHVHANDVTDCQNAYAVAKQRSDGLEKRLEQIDEAIAQRSNGQRNSNIALMSERANNQGLIRQHGVIRQSLATLDIRKANYESALEEAIKRRQINFELKEKLSAEETELLAKEELLRTLAKEVFNEKGVRNSLLAQVAIPYINSKLPEYISRLWSNRLVELTSSRETKGGKSKNEIDIALDGYYTYRGCSSGQRRRLDLAIQFALNDLAIATGSSRIGFLAVDEVLDHLDETGIYAAKEILKAKAEHGTVILSSHSKYAAAITPRHIVAHRKGLATTLEETNVSPVME